MVRYKTLPLGTPAMILGVHKDQPSIYSDALREAGFSPTAVRTEADAIRQLPLLRPRLVLLNSSLPYASDIVGLVRIHNEFYKEKAWIFLLVDREILKPEMIDRVDLVLMEPVRFAQMRDLAIRFRRCIV